MDFDWNDLRYFLALAERQSLEAAAKDVRGSPVTVMRRVKALEQRLGSTLFIRRRDGHTLTPTGKALLNISKDVESSLAEVHDVVSDADARPEGLLRIVTTEIAANEILLPALPKFLADNPGLEIEIDCSPNVMDLLGSAAAISLRFSRPQSGQFTQRKLGNMTYSVWAAENASHDQSIIWAGDFEGIKIDRFIRAFETKSTLRLSTFTGHLSACRAGLGLAVLPDFVANRFPELKKVAAGPTLGAWLVVPEQLRKLKRVDTAIAFVSQAVKNGCY